MTIRYLRNDPGADPRLESNVAPTPQPSGHRVRFTHAEEHPEAHYPSDDDEGFVFWQSREAAIRTLKVWEDISGPLRFWQSGERELALSYKHQSGVLEAFYDRRRLAFSRWEVGAPHTFTAASTDAVAHEVGHAILDSLRPDLWDSLFPEIAAFHEGFADCMALLTSLFDVQQRKVLIDNAPDPKNALASASFVGNVAESVAGAFAASFPASNPENYARKCNNDLQWSIPILLPPNSPREGLSSEPHSFGRIFAGCFYDLIRNIYERANLHTSAGLLGAARSAGTLLAAGIKTAPVEKRFYQAVGRAMILSDASASHHLDIRDAFSKHNIALGSSAMLAPTVAIGGPAPSPGSHSASSRSLTAATRSELCRNVGIPLRTRIKLTARRFGKRLVSQASYRREVSLKKLDQRLDNVVAHVNEVVLLGKSHNQCAALGQLPCEASTTSEVTAFVEMLLKADCVAMQGGTKSDKPIRKKTKSRPRVLNTHAVRKRGNKKVIRRIRCACGASRPLPKT